MRFSEYFRQWMDAYKKDVVRDVTYRKYVMAYNHLRVLCPKLEAENLNKAEYQALLNKYAETHESDRFDKSQIRSGDRMRHRDVPERRTEES